MQALVNLPLASTPIKILHELSIATVPPKMSTLGSSASKVAKIIHYKDAFLDEEIVIPHFDFATMTLADINLMESTLEKKKQQDILKKEYK